MKKMTIPLKLSPTSCSQEINTNLVLSKNNPDSLFNKNDDVLNNSS